MVRLLDTTAASCLIRSANIILRMAVCPDTALVRLTKPSGLTTLRRAQG
jgi:hypothetical protein